MYICTYAYIFIFVCVYIQVEIEGTEISYSALQSKIQAKRVCVSGEPLVVRNKHNPLEGTMCVCVCVCVSVSVSMSVSVSV